MKRILTTLLFIGLLFIPLVVSAKELNTEQIEAEETISPVPFIIDTDFSSDVDDALAISTAMYFQEKKLFGKRW